MLGVNDGLGGHRGSQHRAPFALDRNAFLHDTSFFGGDFCL